MFKKELDIIGVGYSVVQKDNTLHFQLGRSHPDLFPIPSDVQISVQKTRVEVSGSQKDRVHRVAAQIRHLKEPEPYKGKGICYVDEVIRRKKGKKK